MPLQTSPQRPGFLSRKQVAIRLKVTVDKVKGLQEKGLLPGEKKDRAWWYTPEAVEEVEKYLVASVRPRPGELMARAFELFRDGEPDREVVIRLRLTTSRVRLMRAEYDPAGCYLPGDAWGRLLAALNARGMAPKTAGDLADAVESLCESDRQLVSLRAQGA